MIKNRQKTIAYIIKEARGVLDELLKHGYKVVSVDRMADIIDRIEAAWKREREAGAEAAQICGEIGEMVGREASKNQSVTNCNRLENAEAMREALRGLLEIVCIDCNSSRLCKQDIIVAAQKAKGAAEGYANGCERVADLSRRLKVAEKALQNLQERLVSSVYDGTLNPHEALEIAENALSEIREEWGEMNSKQSVTNCNRLENAARMREALRGLLEIVCIDCNSSYKVDGKCVKCPRVVAAECALAAPPSKCDV